MDRLQNLNWAVVCPRRDDLSRYGKVPYHRRILKQPWLLALHRHSTHNPISVQITSDGVAGDLLASAQLDV